MINVRPLNLSDVPRMVVINEQGLPGTGKVSELEMEDVLSLCETALGAYQDGVLVGFVLCLLPQTRYASLNYAWFNQRYTEFLYVDRVAVADDARNNGVGTLLYERVFAHADALNSPVAAEVSLRPPNPGSIRFHERHGFDTVGVFEQKEKAVTMMVRS
ncbi:MAG: GNAT family N-acetyltransferase [Candidatus Poseidoniaceae archaeon]|nr:GNAT family N-acetyltransferase [Candidatus Poseidoniaceae archaeon]